MPREPASDVQIEIAAAAARLIAEDGLDYATAKRKAVEAIAGDFSGARALIPLIPNNALVESELRRWLATFEGARHVERLRALRQLALQLMQRLGAFDPHLVGAVLNGTATDHCDIRMQLFTDSAKDVEIFLLNEGVDFEVFEDEPAPGAAEELLQFVIQPARTRGMPARVGVVLAIHGRDAIRVTPRGASIEPGLHAVEASGRASRAQLEQLLADTEPAP
jgi:hypothetical protein